MSQQTSPSIKHIQVVAGILRKKAEDGSTLYLATQRGYGDYKGMWEFPGGKVEPGETREQALARELKEELTIDVNVQDFLCTVEQDYPGRHITMHCFFCHITAGEITLLEHDSAKWLKVPELRSVEWLPADVAVVESLMATHH